ncbi:MAG TPA: HAMP domain-containing methyl-accepting chemotaxis protein [Burkholderiales bacterium]|jgi:methyl-accepting chemotaxis protein|nr:HAMP domain-containing methyl-accepting chemotaxis protein [Burkholderiales bacterium]
MKITTKLALLSAGALVALGLVASFAFSGMAGMDAASRSITKNRMPSVAAVLVAKEAMANVSRKLLEPAMFALDASPEARKKVLVTLDEKAKYLKTSEKALAEYDALPSEAEEAAQWKIFQGEWKRWLVKNDELGASLKALAAAPDAKAYTTQFLEYQKAYYAQRDLYNTTRDDLDKIAGLNTKYAQADTDTATSTAERAKAVMIAASAAAALGLLAGAFFTALSISRGVKRASDSMVEIARSLDFTRPIEITSKDEISLMSGAFNQVVAIMRESLQKVQTLSATIKDSTLAVTSASNQVETSTQHQTESASSMAAAVEEMTVSIGQVSESANEALSISKKAESMSDQGAQIINQATDDMNLIGEAVDHAAKVIEELGRRSTQVSGVATAISEISNQTNLLALNAAIEAARAGEGGRGFAVVADEVRKLAEQSRASSNEIRETVAEIISNTEFAVAEMHGAVERVKAGRESAHRAGEFMQRLKESANQVAGSVHTISDALKEQSSASQEIARHVESIAQMTEENHAAVKSVADSTRDLMDGVNVIDGTIKTFQVA